MVPAVIRILADETEPGVFWLVLTNAILGVLCLAFTLAVLVATARDFFQRRRRDPQGTPPLRVLRSHRGSRGLPPSTSAG